MIEDLQKHTITIKSPLKRIWELITTPQHIQKWYAFDGATVNLKPGGEISFHWNEHGTYYGVIEKIEPEKLLSLSYVPFIANTKPKESNALHLTITLKSNHGSTTVTLVEEGYQSLSMPDNEKNDNFETNQGAWENSLGLLKELGEKES